MRATFALDPRDKVVFLFSDYTAVDIEKGRKEIEEYIKKEKSGREKTAAKSIYRDLLNLLQHAQKRGLSSEESFAHFDLQKNGFVDVDLLIDGLARLGIGVTYPVAEAVLELIGGIGVGFLSLQDFDRFLRRPPDVEVFEKAAASSNFTTGGDSSVKSSKKKTLSSSEAKSSGANRDSTNDSLFPPAKPTQRTLPPLQGADNDFASLSESQ